MALLYEVGIRGFPAPQNPNQILLFRLAAHCQRLSNTAKYLNYEIDPNFLQSTLTEFVHFNRPPVPFYIRPLIYTSSLGIASRLHDVSKDLLVYGLEMGNDLASAGVNCRITSWLRQDDCS